MTAPGRAVAILGDSVCLPDCDHRGPPFTRVVEDVLQQYGVEFLNWSKPDNMAVMLASEPQRLEELQREIRAVTSLGVELFVILAVGRRDRIDFGEMLAESLGMLVRVCIADNARPLLLEVVPDGIDKSVAREQGAGLVPAPRTVTSEYGMRDPLEPFTPTHQCHRDIAQSVLAVLEQEMNLPLALPALGREDTDDALASRGRIGTRGRASHDDDLLLMASSEGRVGGGRGRATHDDDLLMAAGPVASSSRGSPFEGTWFHKDQPSLFEVVQGHQIVSVDGHRTEMQDIRGNSFSIVHGGASIRATRRGDELHWDDGDIWCLREESPLLDLSPPRRGGSKQRSDAGDQRSLFAAWERAEEAGRHTNNESRKKEQDVERERLDAERRALEEAWKRLEEDQQILQKETEKVSRQREVAR